jgi:Flp pilus assembly protein TadG
MRGHGSEHDNNDSAPVRQGGARGFMNRLLDRARRFMRHTGANVLPMFALTLPVIIVIVGGAIDFSMAVNSKTDLQDATDAAALAVAAAVAKNPNTSVSVLQATAQQVLAADYGSGVTINAFHVCAPVQNDCTNGGTTLKMNTVLINTQAAAPCTMAALLPNVCSGSGQTQTVKTSTTTVIGFGATMQLNIVMDGSASMIVGSTPADVSKIETWVGNNWLLVKPGDPAPYSGQDDPPCAFACHDVGDSTTNADVALGLTHAHSAGATTRFDVMTSAASQLVTYVQNLSTSNTQLAHNTYVFNVMTFDTSLHQQGSTNMSYTAAQSAITGVTPGLDTYLSTMMTSLISQVGTNGTGASTASPLKFVILVTDGLESDRNLDWQNCTSHYNDPLWNWPSTCVGGFAKPINTAQCTQIKNNGVILAVLETPYVPLTGQDPNNTPYESNVRHTIYPSGPNTQSAISTALSSCASSGYYFQATNSSDIATGFLQLTNQFLSHSAYISQ